MPSRLSKYSRVRNYGDHDADNLTIGDQHHTQPTNRRAELWEAYHEVQRKSKEWFKGVEGQHGEINTGAIEQHHSIELLKLGE